MAGGDDIPAREIAELLRDQAEQLCWHLFPQGKVAAGLFCIGSIEGEPGHSLKVRLRGPKRGTWADYAASPGEERGMGDMLKLLKLTVGGGDMGAAIREAKRWLNLDSMDPRALERQRSRAKLAQEKAEKRHAGEVEGKRQHADRLWRSGAPLAPSSPPARYLTARGIDFARLGKLPGAVRFKPDMVHPELGRERPQPAMLTRMVRIDGTPAACHVTFLQRRPDGTWGKLAGVDSAKLIFGPYWGAHIPLWKGAHRGKLGDIPAGVEVHVSEGIEDGLSWAMAQPHARVIAAGTLGNIGALALPPQAGRLTILAQNDAKPEPIAALEAAIRQQQDAARRDGSGRAVACRYPPAGVKDWNDWLTAEEGAE